MGRSSTAYELKHTKTMVKQWYESKAIKLAIAQGILGVIVAFGTEIPDVGWLMVAKTIVDIYIRFITKDSITA